jgi:copper(I)-binding protein
MEPHDHRKAGAVKSAVIKLIVLAAVAGLAPPPAVAADFAARNLKIGHPWTRPAGQGANAAGYLTIASTGPAGDVLIGVETPVAKASLHRSAMQGAMSTMRAMDQGLAIPARQTVALAPGGDHIMLAGLSRPLVVGQKIPATLVFQRAGRVKIEISVETAAPPGQKNANNNQR